MLLRELSIPGFRTLRSYEPLLFKKPQLRRGEITELTLEPLKHLPNAKQARITPGSRFPRHHLVLPRNIETRGEERELELSYLHFNPILQLRFGVKSCSCGVGAVQRP